MQIKRIYIDKNLCLENFDIRFATKNGGSSTILIGPNGSGKSTMLKSLLSIMMSFDSMVVAKNLNFNYEMEYVYAEKEIYIKKNGFNYDISIDEKKYQGTIETINAYFADKIRIFPQRIIAFYSGNNNSFYDEIRKQNFQYKRKCREYFDNYKEAVKDEHGKLIDKTSIPKRKYIYCDESFVPIYLCSILAGHDSYEKELVQKECQLLRLNNIDITINIKGRNLIDQRKYLENRRAIREEKRAELFSLIEYIDYRFIELFKRGELPPKNGKMLFSLSGIDMLGLDSISILEFFEKLSIFFTVEYRVYSENNYGLIKDINLSEGQRQLIKILGMLGVCKNEDCLVLLDEPDAHMNPQWKYDIKGIIDKILKPSVNTQTIIVTHDPLVINGVRKSFIRIFKRDQETSYRTEVIEPDVNTKGMGIDGLLQSQYYGLSSVLDLKTKEKMEKKHDLLVKRKEKGLTGKQEEELKKITEELEDMTFSRSLPTDPYYEEFVAAMHKIYRKTIKNALTKKEIVARDAKAEEILQRVLTK